MTCYTFTKWINDFKTIFLIKNYCSDPTCGGRNYILKWFFVQTILAERYINRREMWVVSLKSSFSVNFGIKEILFWISFFFRGVIEVWSFLWTRDVWQDFVHFLFKLRFFSTKNINSKIFLMLQMKQSCVSNRRKALKKGSVLSHREVYYKKKIDFYLRADILRRTSFLIFFQVTSRLVFFSNPGSIYEKPPLQSNDA